MENLERINTVKYELYSNKFGVLEIQEPKGWDNDAESFSRDSDSRAITSKVDIDLEFFGNAADYLTNIYTVLGIQEKVLLTKYERNDYSLSEEWNIRYIQEIDMGTFKRVSRTGNVTVNSTEGGLYSDIKNRQSDDYDILNNFSADGDDIGVLKTHTFQPLGRKIFIESLLKETRTDYEVKSTRRKSSGGGTRNSRPIPMEVVYNSDTKDIVYPFNGDKSSDGSTSYEEIDNSASEGDTFLFKAEQDKTVSISLDIKLKLIKEYHRNLHDESYDVEFRILEYVDSNLVIKERVNLLNINEPFSDIGVEHVIPTYNREIDLLEGESLSCVIRINTTRDNGSGSSTSALDLTFNTEAKLVVEDLTAYNENVTESKCIKPLDLFDRLVAKITGKTNLVKSSIFESGGEYEYMVVDNGLWCRGFPDTYSNSSGEDISIQMSTSFKDAFNSFQYLEPLTWFTEYIGTTEYLRIEKATHTQQNFIGISLGNVNDIEEKSSKEDYFSNIEIGMEDDLEYEELNGLDETNGKSKFTTFVTKNNETYEAITKYRVDAVGYELTRRLPFSLYPKEDSSRDEDIWMHDAKILPNGTITHNKWDDFFDSKPKGIYDPNSSWNLWLSPMNRLYYGHSYSVKRGLWHYPKKKIRFSSSNANQNLITEYKGRVLSENGGVLIKDMPKARIEATEVSFSFEMTQGIERLFKGFTEINNKYIHNYFGLIEYLENGEKKYGRLVSLEISDEASVTLIKARL